MNARRVVSSAPQAATPSGIAPVHPKVAQAEAPAAASPFASLKQERTVEAKVSTQLLTLAKGGMAKGGMAMGGATQSYQVPDDLMALAGRKKAALTSARPAAEDAAVFPAAPGLGAASLAAAVPLPEVLPSLAAPAPQRSFNWLVVSVIAYAVLCVAHWVAVH